jgi:hypothetical protein
LDGAVKLNDLNVEDITTDDSRVDDWVYLPCVTSEVPDIMQP